jgi:hypothetical protein
MNTWFVRFMKKAELENRDLLTSIERADKGLVDADLGLGVIKQRIARSGEGRSGGYRAVIAYEPGKRAVFLYCFAKNDRSNLKPDELDAFRELAKAILGFNAAEMRKAVGDGRFTEIEDENE